MLRKYWHFYHVLLFAVSNQFWYWYYITIVSAQLPTAFKSHIRVFFLITVSFLALKLLSFITAKCGQGHTWLSSTHSSFNTFGTKGSSSQWYLQTSAFVSGPHTGSSQHDPLRRCCIIHHLLGTKREKHYCSLHLPTRERQVFEAPLRVNSTECQEHCDLTLPLK